MQKPAETAVPLHEPIQERWSPIAFDSKPVEPDKLISLFEAIRWAPSCFNEQPWRIFVAISEDAESYGQLLDCLVEANQAWAGKAPVLMIASASTKFARNGKPNRHGPHDVGLALQNMAIQAQSVGLVTHMMAGFDIQKTRHTLQIPEDYEPMTAIAIGYPGTVEDLPEGMRERETSPRSRKSLGEVIFTGAFGTSSPLIEA